MRLALRFLLAAALTMSQALAADPQAARYYEDAQSRYDKRDFDGSVIQLRNALRLDRSMLPAHLLLGKALFESGDAAAAEAALDEALRMGVDRAEVVVPLARALVGQAKPQLVIDQPRFSDAGLPADARFQLLLVKANAAADTGDPRGALAFLDAARALAPADVRGWLAEVPLRIRGGQLEQAAAAADKALALQAGNAEAHYIRGMVWHVKGALPSALQSYAKALALDPGHTEALASRAGVLMDLGRLPEVKADLAKLAALSPKDPRAAYLSALVAEREGRATDAKAALAEVVAVLDPAPIEMLRFKPQLLMLAGLAQYGLGHTDKAKPYLDAFLRLQPGSPAAKLMARIHLQDGNAGRAIETLDQYLRRQPNDSQATLLLASAHMSQGRHARAVTLLRGALQRDDRVDYRSALGLAMMRAGKGGDAVAELEAVYKRDPGHVQSGTALAALYLQLGRAAKALAVADQLAKRRPNQPGLLHLQGVARAATGDVNGARQAFESASRLDARFIDPQVELARLDARAGNLDAALSRLTTLAAANDRHLPTLALIGELHARKGALDEAQRWLEKADAVSGPDDLEAGTRLVEFHLAHRQIDRAQEAMKRLTTRAPEALRVLILQSRVELAAGLPRAARTSLTRASSAAAYDPRALTLIAELQLAAGDAAAAGHSLDKALKEKPDLLRAQALMVAANISLGELAKAEQLARQVVARQPKLGLGHALLGDVALARQSVPSALEAYRKAHQLEQTPTSAMRLFAALARGESTAAVQFANQWLKSRPKDLFMQRALADAHARDGNWPLARQAYEKLLAASPGDAEAANNLANVLIATKDPGALAMAEKAMALKPGAAHILSTAGWAAHNAGQQERALALLRDARLRDPQSNETRYYLGTVLASTGRSQEARTELEAALRSGRPFASAKDAESLLRTLR